VREHAHVVPVLTAMTSPLRVALFAIVSVAAACHHDKQQTLPTPEQPAAQASTTPQPVSQPVSTNVSAGNDLVSVCKLHFDNQTEAPKFDFDQFQLSSTDRDVLSQIAGCVTTGPLKGKKLSLVGRADPRGTSEYNLGLGDRRAHTVESYLQRLGLATSQVGETTRGSLDATGTDEASWRTDRRVDVELAN
jgi:peptidoglycan-associated lipoprotein